MANPTRHDVYIDAAATAFSVGYRNEGYIGEQILPVVKVAKPTGKYFVFDQAAWLRDEAAVRAVGARAQRGEWGMDSQGDYTCIDYAFAMGLPDSIVAQADNPIQPVRTTVEYVTDRILLARERRVAAALFNATTFAGYTATAEGLSGGAAVQWSTFETSDPVQDVEVMRHNIISKIGRKPNVLIVGEEVHTKLRIHPAIRAVLGDDRERGIISDADLRQVFDVDKYLVGRALYTASEEGTTLSQSFVWGKYALLAYITPSPALMSPSLGYVLEYGSRQVKNFREEQEEQNVYQVSECTDEIICSPQSGYLLTSVVA